MNPSPELVADLYAKANRLTQSDSRAEYEQGINLGSLARRLELDLFAQRGLVICSAHVDAYRDHLQAEARARFLATAEPRFIAAHAAIERVTGGRISYSI